LREHKYIFKLQITGGLALINVEVYADYFEVNKESQMLEFREHIKFDSNTMGWYPIGCTIISERIKNPDYIIPNKRTTWDI